MIEVAIPATTISVCLGFGLGTLFWLSLAYLSYRKYKGTLEGDKDGGV